MANPNEAQMPPAMHAALVESASWTEPELLHFLGRLSDSMPLPTRHRAALVFRPTIDFIACLPQELADKILLLLPLQDLFAASLVSQRWYHVSRSDFLWRRRLESASLNSDFFRRYAAFAARQRPEEVQGSQFSRFRNLSIQSQRCLDNWKGGNAAHHRINCESQGVYCLEYDENKIITGNRDHTIKIWNLNTLNCDFSLRGHTGSVLCLQFDNERIISGSSDSTIRVWDMATKECRAVLDQHSQSVLHMRFLGDYLVSCSKDHSVIIWRKTEHGWRYTPQHVLRRHHAAVNVVEFDERFVVSGSGDRTIIVWRTDTGEHVRTLSGHTRGIACMQYRGDYVVSGSSDKSIIVWNVMTGQMLRQLEGHTDLVRCIRFNDNFIVSGSYDHTIRVWDFHTGRQHCILRGHSHRVFRVQFDSLKIISSSQDDHIILWDFTPTPLSSSVA
eukprot:m.293970 g.293970  ORF g.293970 m.293970 type:complete len:445 (-) comp12898_c0_seq1:1883-3217(-)